MDWTELIDKVKKKPIKVGGLQGFKYSVQLGVKDTSGLNKKVVAEWFSTIDKDEVIDADETDVLKRFDWDFLRCTIEQFEKGKFVWSENGQSVRVNKVK